MIIATLHTTSIGDMQDMPPEMGQLFHGIQAHRDFGGNPTFFGRGNEAQPLASSQKLFGLFEGEEFVGGVFITDINMPHRRACFHVSVLSEHWKKGHSMRGLTLAATILGDSFGIECFYTYVLPESPGARVAAAAGLKQWGRLEGYSLTPNGRSDTLILGGAWKDLRERHLATINAIKWQGA